MCQVATIERSTLEQAGNREHDQKQDEIEDTSAKNTATARGRTTNTNDADAAGARVQIASRTRALQ